MVEFLSAKCIVFKFSFREPDNPKLLMTPYTIQTQNLDLVNSKNNL